MTVDKAKYSVRAASRALKILKCFDTSHVQKTHQEIARETGIPASTAFKLLQVLVEEGFLAQDPANGRFCIGLESFRLGELYITNKPLVAVADRWLEQLAERVGLSANLGLQDGGYSVAVSGRLGSNRIKVETSLGDRIPMYMTAIGKALALDYDDEQLGQLFPPPPWPQRTPRTITCLERLSRELLLSRERGYTVDLEEGTIGIRCVGCPIRDRRGQIVAAISVTGTSIDITDETLPRIADIVKDVGNRLSHELGGNLTR